VPEHAIPLDPVGPQDLPLRLLIATGHAPGVALGGVHLGPPLLEVVSLLGSRRGALNLPAPCLFAVHRSSSRSKLAFTPAYHLTTG
jgi:hypothetical protein